MQCQVFTVKCAALNVQCQMLSLQDAVCKKMTLLNHMA